MEALKQTWQGYKNLERIFIFGDSYSSVLDLRSMINEKAPEPTAELPLGVPFPGNTWTEGPMPNWVGYLLNTWPSERPLLIHDFAIGGDTVHNMGERINELYQEQVSSRCKCNEHWKPANSLFVFWIGINDLGYLGEEQSIKMRLMDLFSCVRTVYDTGARAFLFVDLPPINRAPFIVKNEESNRAFVLKCRLWNENLNEMVQQFSKEHPDASCFQYSSFRLLTRILDDPTEYGFDVEDARKPFGGIWADHIHPTSRVHEQIARDIREFMMTI